MITNLITGRTARFKRFSVMSSAVHLAFHVEIDKINKKLSTSRTYKAAGMPVLLLSSSRCSDTHFTNRYLLTTLKTTNNLLMLAETIIEKYLETLNILTEHHNYQAISIQY